MTRPLVTNDKPARLTRKMVADQVDLSADTLYTMLRNANRVLDPDDPLLALLHHMREYANSIYGVSYDSQGDRIKLPWSASEAPLLLRGVKGEH